MRIESRAGQTVRVFALILAIAYQPLLFAQTGSASPQEISQATPNTVTGRLDSNSEIFSNGNYYNAYPLEGNAGDAILIEMTSQDVDALVILVKPGGEILASYDGGGEGNDVKFMLRLPDTGVYQIFATASSPGEGQYSLAWRSLTAAEQNELPSWDLTYYSDDSQISSDYTSETILQNSFTQAIPLYEQQISVLRAQLGDKHPEVAGQMTILATLYSNQSRYTEAEPLLTEALSIYQSLPDSYPAERALILYNLGGIAYTRGQLDQAGAFYSEALEILQQDSGGREDLIPLMQTNLGIVYQAQETNSESLSSLQTNHPSSEAESLFAQAVEIARNNEDPTDLADKINTLASFYLTQRRYEDAETLYREAMEIDLGLYPDAEIESPSISTSLNNIALIYQIQGRYEEAESLYKEALSNYESYLTSISTIGDNGYTTPQIQQNAASMRIYMVPMFYNLAGLYRAKGEVSLAIETLSSGIEIEDESLDISLANLSDSDRIAYIARLSNTLNYVISLHLDTAPNSVQASQFALTNLLRRKGRVLEAGIRAQEILRQRGTPEDIELLNQLSKLQQEIAELTSQPSNSLSSGEYQTRLAQLRSEINLVEASIARRSADVALVRNPVDFDAVRTQIPSDAVLVEYALYQPFDPSNPVSDRFNETNFTAAGSNNFANPRYAAYLLFPDGRIEAVDLGDAAAIDAAVQSFVGLLQDPNADFQRSPGARPTTRQDVVETVTTDLKALVFDPISPYLQDVDHLLISPDSELNRLPFEALQMEAGSEYLVQQYQISYLNSGRDLLKLDVLEPSSNPAVIVANPDYQTADDTVQLAQAGNRSIGENRRSTELSQLQVRPLPGTAAEVSAIQPLLPNATVLVEERATENLLKQVEAPRILHIATHGFFLPDVELPEPDELNTSFTTSDNPFASGPQTNVMTENPLLRSGLALAGFNTRSSGTEDGVFTALEASQLNLFGTQLVVLSACDTGLGDIANGEGVYGLRRAFALAGAETQLLSLWQVSDFGTQSLMARYYENLTAGMSRSEALREVQLEMIEEGGQYSHPYYWAAFILTGDWRPLD